MEESIGFVGGGRVVSIILGGWSRARTMPDKVVIHDVDADVLSRLAARHPQVEASAHVASAAAQEIVFLATDAKPTVGCGARFAGAEVHHLQSLADAGRFQPDRPHNPECAVDRRSRLQSRRLCTGNVWREGRITADSGTVG